MHNPESVLENEEHKILRDFEIQTDQLIPARRPEQGLLLKKPSRLTDIVVLADYKVKIKESENIDKYLHLAKELKMAGKVRVTVILIFVYVLRTASKT